MNIFNQPKKESKQEFVGIHVSFQSLPYIPIPSLFQHKLLSFNQPQINSFNFPQIQPFRQNQSSRNNLIYPFENFLSIKYEF